MPFPDAAGTRISMIFGVETLNYGRPGIRGKKIFKHAKKFFSKKAVFLKNAGFLTDFAGNPGLVIPYCIVMCTWNAINTDKTANYCCFT
jgi:hypothetical protein